VTVALRWRQSNTQGQRLFHAGVIIILRDEVVETVMLSGLERKEMSDERSGNIQTARQRVNDSSRDFKNLLGEKIKSSQSAGASLRSSNATEFEVLTLSNCLR